MEISNQNMLSLLSGATSLLVAATTLYKTIQNQNSIIRVEATSALTHDIVNSQRTAMVAAAEEMQIRITALEKILAVYDANASPLSRQRAKAKKAENVAEETKLVARSTKKARVQDEAAAKSKRKADKDAKQR